MEIVSLGFPEILNGAETTVIEGSKATLSNMRLFLASWKKSLFGDPYFGTNLKKFLYDQNNIVLQDLIIDDIYVSLTTYFPQIHLTRKDITLVSEGVGIYATINCINKLDGEPNLYQILLTEEL